MPGVEDIGSKRPFFSKKGLASNPPGEKRESAFKNPLGAFFSSVKKQLRAKFQKKSDARISRYGVTHELTNARA